MALAIIVAITVAITVAIIVAIGVSIIVATLVDQCGYHLAPYLCDQNAQGG